MTILEFLQTKSAEEIAERLSNVEEDSTSDKFGNAFSIGCNDEYFDISEDCPYECEYLSSGWNYEDAWMNGMCNLERYGDECKGCPYKIDRSKVLKREIIEWLNSEI